MATPERSDAMSGRLYLARSGWLLLSVPNALVRGVFDTMDEQGIELPPGPDDMPFQAHITVMRPEEIERIGGPDGISERGHMFHYVTGGLKSVVPGSWPEMSRCWLLDVKSPELERLRRSYGLSSLPNDGKYAFHITCAVRRRKVLQRGDVRKAAEAVQRYQQLGLLPLATAQ